MNARKGAALVLVAVLVVPALAACSPRRECKADGVVSLERTAFVPMPAPPPAPRPAPAPAPRPAAPAPRPAPAPKPAAPPAKPAPRPAPVAPAPGPTVVHNHYSPPLWPWLVPWAASGGSSCDRD